LFVAHQENMDKLKNALSPFLQIDIGIDYHGSMILHESK
jgi:hypothetical protein